MAISVKDILFPTGLVAVTGKQLYVEGQTGDVAIALPFSAKWFAVIKIKVTATSGSPTSWNFLIKFADDSSGTNSVTVAKTDEMNALGTRILMGFVDVDKGYIIVDQTITGGTSPTVTYDVEVDAFQIG